MTTTAPYGSWRSAISAQTLTADSVRLSEPQPDGDDCYWLESRPQEQGRNALVHLTADGTRRDLLPAPMSVRTRLNEYGGGSYCVFQGQVYLVLDSDQRVYRLAADGQLEAISPEGAYRYADLSIDASRNRLICVREDHSARGADTPKTEERHEIVALALDDPEATQVLVSGADFYSNPRISPDGTQMSWLCWGHPNMPWDGTECHVATLNADGEPEPSQCIAGGANESVFQPQWSPEGELFFVSDHNSENHNNEDHNNWWNLYRWADGQVDALCTLDAEFATPQWVCGMSTYAFLNSGTLLCCYTRDGLWQLAHFDLTHLALTDIETGLTDISSVHCANGRAWFLGAGANQSTQLWRFDPQSELDLVSVARSAQDDPPTEYISEPQSVSFATRDDEQAHGFYYPPHNPDFQAPDGDFPPLLVVCHGGPTGATSAALNLKIQYWTSRGFAVLDVNYRGSTGYGRSYRERLKGHWGHTDVIDVCSGADHLVQAGLAHPEQCAIRGSSAGGYTVLAALTFDDRFQAGASLYGIGDLESLARDTHKFESRYLDTLVGPYPAQASLYRERSPIHHVHRLRCPVIFLQGLQDKIVPPDQAQTMARALSEKGVPNALVEFPDEGHGFRQADNIERALEAELYFYGQVFGFTPADELPPLDIVNLPEKQP